jgi:NADPH:quinone reductase
LVYEEVPARHPGAGEVVVSIRAAGVNFMDGLIAQGKYQTRPPLPFSPGAEVAGIIKEVGAGVTGIVPGMRVLVATGHGGFAEEVVTPAAGVMPLPEGMDFTTAASFPIVYATSHHALKDRGQLRAGETLLVLGAAGGVGLTAVEIGKVMGAKVIACASSEEKLALCKAHGADALINYATSDLREKIKELTGGKGVDVVYDSVGKTTFDKGLNVLRPRGMMVLFGGSSGAVASLDPLVLTQKGSLFLTRPSLGNYIATAQELQQRAAAVFGMIRDGKLKLRIEHVYPLAQVQQAHRDLEGRKTTGKLLLLP